MATANTGSATCSTRRSQVREPGCIRTIWTGLIEVLGSRSGGQRGWTPPGDVGDHRGQSAGAMTAGSEPRPLCGRRRAPQLRYQPACRATRSPTRRGCLALPPDCPVHAGRPTVDEAAVDRCLLGRGIRDHDRLWGGWQRDGARPVLQGRHRSLPDASGGQEPGFGGDSRRHGMHPQDGRSPAAAAGCAPGAISYRQGDEPTGGGRAGAGARLGRCAVDVPQATCPCIDRGFCEALHNSAQVCGMRYVSRQCAQVVLFFSVPPASVPATQAVYRTATWQSYWLITVQASS